MCNSGFDLILQDTVFWPGALLGELLDIPIVEVLPLPIMTHKEYEMSFPNPLAYAPQMGLGYTVQMVLTKFAVNDFGCTCACIYAWAYMLVTAILHHRFMQTEQLVPTVLCIR